jgi:hypothetical protein
VFLTPETIDAFASLSTRFVRLLLNRGNASSDKVVVPVRVEESSMLSRRMKAKTKECDGRGKTSATLLVVSVPDGGNCSRYPILGRVGSWYDTSMWAAYRHCSVKLGYSHVVSHFTLHVPEIV